MPRLIYLSALLVALSAALASAQFVLPKGASVDLSAPIMVAWDRPKKPSADWVGLLNITAWLDWTTPAGVEGFNVFDVALSRSSDEPGDAIWDPREPRAFLQANSTYAASIRFDSTMRKEPDGADRSLGTNLQGYSSVQFKIEGFAPPRPAGSGAVRKSIGGFTAVAVVVVLSLL